MTLQEKDKAFVWHPFTPLQGAIDPILITSAEGIYLHAQDGRKIIDAISSWWVNLHGHANPILAKAIAAQAHELEHVIFAGFTHPPAILLAENLLAKLPTTQSKIFFSDNGSTAVEVALKMAFQYWHNQGAFHKKRVIAIKGAYHGDTFGAMSVGDRGLFTKPFSNYLFPVEYIDFPKSDQEEYIIRQFNQFMSSGEIGAFIFEPLVQAAAGMRMYSVHFLDTLISIAQKNEVICIADEVFTGFYRTGKFLASDYLTHIPDIFTLSKGITGGTLPLGATSCSQKIVDSFQSDQLEKTFFHGHSYTANPLACAAANASYKLLFSDDTQESISAITNSHQNFLKQIKHRELLVRCESLGTILALEIKTPVATSYTNELRNQIYSHFIAKGILLRPLGNVLYFLPPYIISAEECQVVYSAINEFLELLINQRNSN